MNSVEAQKLATLTLVQTGQNEISLVPVVARATLEREAKRPAWVREMVAEFFGVFIYLFFGVAATAAFVFAQLAQTTAQLTFGSLNAQALQAARLAADAVPAHAPMSNVQVLQQDAAVKALHAIVAYASIPNSASNGNLLTVGLAFGLGITFAIITCAPVSGGHFSPAMTLLAMAFRGFPVLKGVRFMLAQFLGGFVACGLVYGIYHEQFKAVQSGVLGSNSDAQHALIKIFCSIPDAGQNMGYLFLVEFMVCLFMGLITMACIDQANPFLSPASAPMTIGIIYAVCVWAFGELNVSLNTAKDFPGRLMAGMIVGRQAWTFGHSAWIGTLVNIPAMMAAAVLYEYIFKDTQKHVDMGLVKVEDAPFQRYGSASCIEHREVV